ncbi:hypothetical protein AAC387_Pa02g1575 [Persea americana]
MNQRNFCTLTIAELFALDLRTLLQFTELSLPLPQGGIFASRYSTRGTSFENSSSILARFYGSSSPPVRKLRNINTNEFDPERDTYILCHHGVRSLQVAKWLLTQVAIKWIWNGQNPDVNIIKTVGLKAVLLM